MYKPDFSKSQDFILSNDAFFYLYREEEPLDEDNLEEALEVADAFPNGFIIKEGWRYIEDSDLVEATFVPLIEDIPEGDFDMQCELAKGYFWQIKVTQNGTHVKLWKYWSGTGCRVYAGEFPLKYNSTGKLVGFATGEWRKGNGCLMWLKFFTSVKSTPPRISNNLLIGL